MSMRSQVYDWDAGRNTPLPQANAGQRTSIFIGGFGNNITKPAETSATEFVVIEDIAVTPTLPVGIDTQVATTLRGLTYDSGVGQAGPVPMSKSVSTPRITSWTQTMFLTTVSPELQVLTPEALTSSLRSTFTPMSMSFPDKFGMFW